MPRRGSNVYKRKDGRWEGRYSKGRDAFGKIVYGYVYAKTCAEVKRRLDTERREVPKTKFPSVDLTAAAERWLSAISLKVRPSTFAGYEAAVRTHILPSIGGVKLGKLNAASIGAFAREKLACGRADGSGGLAPKTVRDILSVLKGIIDFAADENLMENPVAILYPKQQRGTARVLSRSEQSALKRALLENVTIYNAGILLCLYTGLRIGEVCGLRWRDFSPNLDKVSVYRTLQRIANRDGAGRTKLYIGVPKSPSSIRDVPIPKFITSILTGFDRNGDMFFLSTPSKPVTEPRTMQNHFKRVIKTAGLPDANFHCLRHTFSTLCVEADVDVKSLSEMLGHANVNITLNRYVHSTFEQKREGMNRLERYLGL